jgi:FAD/FMN-containing dehydrogenase
VGLVGADGRVAGAPAGGAGAGGAEASTGESAGRPVRGVRAPARIVRVDAADMTVRVRGGTTVAELDAALAEVGQTVALPAWPGATVGGVLAVGRSGIRRLGWGPVRDTVLQVRHVSAEGRVVAAGGPTVKNVSGFDLCRLLVGSLGTLGLLAEVVLRTRPLPRTERWLRGEVDPFRLLSSLHRPAAVLWDGTTTWALLEGHPADVATQADAAGLDDAPEGRPDLPPHRWSLPASALGALAGDGRPAHATAAGSVAASLPEQPSLAGSVEALRSVQFVAEIGVGVVHADVPQPARTVDPTVVALNRRIKQLFDPTGRLNPAHDPLVATS